MPRKGSRASRAAKAKAKAFEDGDRSIDPSSEGRAGEPSSSASSSLMNKGKCNGEGPVVGTSANEHETKGDAMEGVESGGGVEQVVMEIDEEEEDQQNLASPMKSQSGEGMTSEGGEHDQDEDDDDNEGDDDDDDDSEDDDRDEDDEQDHGRIMMDEEDDDEDDFETSLGLMGDLAGLGGGSGAGGPGSMGGYGSGGGESDIDPPQTYDANGVPLDPSSSSMDDRTAMQAAMEAAELAAELEEARAFGGGGGGGVGRGSANLRALQGMMSGMSSRLRNILASLKNRDGDASSKLISLQDLAELLSVSTEDTLAGYFSTSAFVKEIITILKGDSNPTGGAGAGGDGAMSMEEMIAFGIDPAEAGVGGVNEENNVQMMLLACRCLANLMEALPGSAHAVVHAGAVPVLCSKLLEIQYIDLAEQTLSVSSDFPRFDASLLVAMLIFLTFSRPSRKSRKRCPRPSFAKEDLVLSLPTSTSSPSTFNEPPSPPPRTVVVPSPSSPSEWSETSCPSSRTFLGTRTNESSSKPASPSFESSTATATTPINSKRSSPSTYSRPFALSSTPIRRPLELERTPKFSRCSQRLRKLPLKLESSSLNSTSPIPFSIF